MCKHHAITLPTRYVHPVLPMLLRGEYCMHGFPMTPVMFLVVLKRGLRDATGAATAGDGDGEAVLEEADGEAAGNDPAGAHLRDAGDGQPGPARPSVRTAPDLDTFKAGICMHLCKCKRLLAFGSIPSASLVGTA